jgi:hypothetical protein
VGLAQGLIPRMIAAKWADGSMQKKVSGIRQTLEVALPNEASDYSPPAGQTKFRHLATIESLRSICEFFLEQAPKKEGISETGNKVISGITLMLVTRLKTLTNIRDSWISKSTVFNFEALIKEVEDEVKKLETEHPPEKTQEQIEIEKQFQAEALKLLGKNKELLEL